MVPFEHIIPGLSTVGFRCNSAMWDWPVLEVHIGLDGHSHRNIMYVSSLQIIINLFIVSSDMLSPHIIINFKTFSCHRKSLFSRVSNSICTITEVGASFNTIFSTATENNTWVSHTWVLELKFLLKFFRTREPKAIVLQILAKVE